MDRVAPVSTSITVSTLLRVKEISIGLGRPVVVWKSVYTISSVSSESVGVSSL